MAGVRIVSILRCLASDKVETGWSVFLQSYSRLLRDVIRRYEFDEYRAQECFEFICAKLSDDNFRRLLVFEPEGPAAFPTWLTVVCTNLCIDWRRQVYGRFREPAKIQALPQLDRMVFHYSYRLGLTGHACIQALRTRFPSVTGEQVSEIRGRIHTLLSPRQRWELSSQRPTSVSIDDPDISATEEVAGALRSTAHGPELLAEIGQDQRRLRNAMTHLEPRQRLLIQLRFQQDLTLEDVANLCGVNSPSQASREIDRALAALAKAMKF